MSAEFAELVNGKTIAVVGPAPAPYDQSAEVDAHDLVFRTSYGFRAGDRQYERDDPALHAPGQIVPGYGTRTDVSFYNSQGGRMAHEGHLDECLADLKFALWKDAKRGLPNRGLCGERVVYRPTERGHRGAVINVNQITGILFDLAHFEPADVTVFGADFYAGPIEQWYDPKYVHRENLRDKAAHIDSVRQHDQHAQRRVVRAVLEAKGWPTGDERFLKALHMGREEHEAILEAIESDGPMPAWAANVTPDAAPLDPVA